MKKVVLLILLCFISINYISAIELTLSKDVYSPQETLQLQMTGNFISLSSDNIKIFKDNIPRQNPVISDFTKQGDIYYFYAVLPNEEGNYTLKIQGSQYTSDGEIKTDDIIKNFKIIKGNNSNSVLSFNPGFFVTTTDSITMNVKSPYSNQKITATLVASNSSQVVSLIEDSEKTVTFDLKGLTEGMTNLRIGNYLVPVFIKKSTPIPTTPDIVFSPVEIKATITTGSNYFFKVILENQGNNNLTDIKITNNINATISPSSFFIISKGQRAVINITIPVLSTAKGSITGNIDFSYDTNKVSLPVNLDITTNSSAVNLNNTTTPGLSCTRIGGIRCVSPETCSGDTTSSLEGPCCLGKCSIPSPAQDNSWVTGIILILVVFAGLAVFLYFQRKKLKPKSSEDIINERQKRFEQRNNIPQRPNVPPAKPDNPPSPSSKEVNGSLGRIR